MAATELINTPLKYLDKALGRLREMGLLPEKPEEAPIVALINQISDFDETKAVAIARTLSHASVFNEVVREQITLMKVGERYEKSPRPSTASATMPRRMPLISRKTAKATIKKLMTVLKKAP